MNDPLKQQEMASEISLLKLKAMRLGLYRTGRMLEIATQEIGWELQGVETPEWQKKRQQKTLTP